jgi:hypothetical protein
MSRLTGPTIIEAQDLYIQSDSPLHTVGQLAWDQWGNRYRYVKVGAAPLVTGNLLQEPAEDTNFVSMTPASTSNIAIGSTDVTVVLGGTAVTASQFVGGTLIVSTSTGIGQLFRILSHTVQTSTTGNCTFYLDRPLKIAIVVATSKVSVRLNPYMGVIQAPITTMTGGPVGVALYAMSANYYGWIQSGGEATVLFDTGANTANDQIGIAPSVAVAGTVKAAPAASGVAVIGFSRQVASVDSTNSLVHLLID